MFNILFKWKLNRIKKRGERYKQEKELRDAYAEYVPERKKRKISNIMLFIVIAVIMAYTIGCFWLTYRTGMVMDSTLTTCVYAFFGSELFALLTIKTTKIIKGTDRERELSCDLNYEDHNAVG